MKWLWCLIVACVTYQAVPAVEVPSQAWQYKHQITRAVWTHHGTGRYLSATAAQIHQESYWRPRAESWAGAQGLTQFMPATARGTSDRCGLGVASPFDPAWAIQAQSCYMAYLYGRMYEFVDGCERFAAALSSYNGGAGNANRQRRVWAAETGHNPDSGVVWFDGVENYRVRSESAHEENRGYPRRILLLLTPNYVQAGYGGSDLCKQRRVIR